MLESEYFESSPTKCPYLADKEEIVAYKYLLAPSIEHYSKYVQRGWRRFGSMLNRPKCASCKECINLRIDVEKFEFSKSARRILRKSKKFKIKIFKPSINEKRIELYNKYHSFMNNKKNWSHNIINKELYKQSFIDNASNFGYELVYYDDDKIVAIDFIDIINDGISAIYFFYDPDYSSYSLGKLSIYYQIQKAKELKLKWIYMGYYVEECPSLSYKANYKPYQLLKGIPSINEDDIWYYPKKTRTKQ